MNMGADSWPTIRIGDLGQVFTGRTPSTERPSYFGYDFPFITPGDMHQGKYARETQRSLSEEGATVLSRIRLPANSVCVSCIGWQMGEVIMTDRPSFSNQQINTIVPTTGIDPSFLYYSLRPRKQELLSLGATTGVRTPILNKSAFCDLKVSVPPLPIQQCIAGILSAYDELIENSQRRIKILEAMARALYRAWFVNFRFPGHESVPRVASPLGEIPQGWEVRKLGDLISIDKGVSYNGAGLTEDGNPMVNLKNILAGGGFRRDATKPYSGDFKPRHTVKPGDIILANTDLTQAGNVVASAALVPRFTDERPTLISHHLFAVRLPAGMPTPFIYHLLLEDGFRGFAKGYAIGTTVLGLPREGVLNFLFALPPDSLIGEFAKHVEPIHQLIETIADRIDNLRRTRDLLLPRLLSGQIDLGFIDTKATS